VFKLISHPFRRKAFAIERRHIEKRVLSLLTPQERFTEIYKSNYWGSDESVSGYGSTLEGTASLRAKLPEIIGSILSNLYWTPLVGTSIG
jgi:hypothetical protein